MKVFIASYNIVCQNDSGGIQVRVINYLKNIKNYADVKLFNMWSDRISDCDILHVFKANIDTYSLMVQAKEKGKRVILSSVVPQEKSFHVLHNIFWSKLLRLQTGYSIIQKELMLADCVIAQTIQEKAFINKHYRISANKIFVIPNGVSINFEESNRLALQDRYPVSQKYLLMVGRFDENKNQLSVIRALNGTGVKVLFVGGSDPQSKEYYQRCMDEADENFTFIGWLENGSPSIQSAFMNAQAVILPSHKEIFGNSLIEAGAAGANLIATKSLPLKSMGIAEYCYTIDPNDINDIRDKVLLAMAKGKNPNQSQKVTSMFSWDAVSKSHYDIYRRVLG